MFVNDDDAVPHSSAIYGRLAPAYDKLWPAVAGRRLSDAIDSAGVASGDRVLEVGVGTGASLKYYPTDCDFTGVDLSESMLAEAQRRIEENRWRHIRLMPMNAEELEFDDDAFDVVTSFHTISVVSDPHRMMSEVIRVCRPGGRIVIVNHFRSTNPLIAGVVDRAGNLTKRLGWRTDLDRDDIFDALPMQLESQRKPNPLSLFTVVTARCTK